MSDSARIYISDVHMSSQAAIKPPPGQHAYGWLPPAKVDRLARFLYSDELAGCRELVLLGDIVDYWIVPHDVRPPTAIEVLDAPHNKAILDGLKAFAARPGNKITWIEGNHDAGAGSAAAHRIAPNVRFVPGFDDPPLRLRHGHENCLFNAPDPAGRQFPLGYFISRFVATAAARGLAPVGLNLQLLWHSGPQLVALLGKEPLAKCVFDAVCHAADVSLTDGVIMPDGSARNLAEIRATYQNLVAEWDSARGNAMEAVLCEWEPFQGLDNGKPYINIFGHSHDRYNAPIHATGGRYVNVGSWCGKQAHYATTWIEQVAGKPTMNVRLSRWEPDID